MGIEDTSVMDIGLRITKNLAIVLMSILSLNSLCHAHLDLESTQPVSFPIDNFTPKLTNDDVSKMIPYKSLVPGSTSTEVASKIADRTLGYLFSTSQLKETALARMAEKTKEKLRSDLVLLPEEKAGTTHKFTVQLEAFQSLAKMEYSGWLDASINYNIRVASTIVSLSEKIFSDKVLSLKHESNKDQDFSMIGLAWPW